MCSYALFLHHTQDVTIFFGNKNWTKSLIGRIRKVKIFRDEYEGINVNQFRNNKKITNQTENKSVKIRTKNKERLLIKIKIGNSFLSDNF